MRREKVWQDEKGQLLVRIDALEEKKEKETTQLLKELKLGTTTL